MPTYEFRCPRGHDFEKFYKTISAALTELPCPECGETATRQLSAGAGLLFKGSGFYITDYGKDGKKDQREAAAKAEKKPTESTSASSTPTPAAVPATPAAPAAAPKADSK